MYNIEKIVIQINYKGNLTMMLTNKNILWILN